MTRLLAVLAFSLSLVAGAAAAEPWPALIGAGEMKSRYTTPELRIVDLRSADAYARGHADGAVSMPVAEWKAAGEDGLARIINRAGIHPDRPIVLVHGDTSLENFVDTAWIAWELKRRGVPSVSILEGGMTAWRAAGLRLTDRVHKHGVYGLAYEREAPDPDPRKVEEIRLGLAEGGLIEASSELRVSPRPRGVARVSLADLLATEGALSDPVGLLEEVKNMPLPFGKSPLIVFGETVEDAAAFGFLAGDVLGIRGVVVLPDSPAELGLADLSD